MQIFTFIVGYKLTGPSVLRCGTNQEFDPAPTCEDINECLSSQCDSVSTECKNTLGGFYCPCRPGFASSLDCRPVGDLGLINGAIPDESIITSIPESGYSKGVKLLLIKYYVDIDNKTCIHKTHVIIP